MQLVDATSGILHHVCRSDFTIGLDTIQEMFILMRKLGGLGLAAPQVGIDARLFVTNWDEVFVNPKVIGVGLRRPIHEGCLSLPGQDRLRKRFWIVKLGDGREFEGEEALVLQHEVDHLNGILITDQ